MDVYRTLAAILVSNQSPSSSPTSLIISQLSSPSTSSEQKAGLSRILAELLRATPDAAAKNVLQDYVRSLILSADLNDGSKDFELAMELANDDLLPGLLDVTLTTTGRLLKEQSNANVSSDEGFAVDFSGFFETHLSGSRSDIPLALEEVQDLKKSVTRLLRFWHFVFLKKDWLRAAHPMVSPSLVGEMLPVHLLGLMALRDLGIAMAASNALCQLLNDFPTSVQPFQLLWDGLSRLVAAEIHVDLALAVWLRWAAASGEGVRPSQGILGNDSYWTLIQKCLATGFSERRKYSLHLLMKSISSTLEPVDTRTFTFDPKHQRPITASWNKYTTLIEIVSLSTSPNQLRDATPDLKRLLDGSSHIPASWMVVLVTLGFQSGSGGVSRGFWDIMISLEPKRLGRLFGGPEGRKLLQDVLFPYAAYAANFVIGRSTPEKCEHGTQLAEWLGRVVDAVESKQDIARAILVWIDEREDNLFAPARAWILKGLLEGVGAERVFGTEDLRLLVRIAKMQRFTKLKVDVCLAAVLRLLLAVDIDKVGFAEFWTALAEVVSKKEYLLSEDYLSTVQKRVEKSLLDSQQLDNVERLAFGQEGSPSRIELLQGAFTVYCLGCRSVEQLESPDAWIQRFQLKIKTEQPRLSFWTILLSNRQLFGCVNRLFDIGSILSHIFENHHTPSESDMDIASLLEQWPVEAQESATSLAAIFSFRWRSLQESKGDKYEQNTEQKRTHWALICANSIRLMSGTSFAQPSVDDVVDLIDAFPIPPLGRNKHDNVEMIATVGKFIGAMFRILEHSISTSEELNVSTICKTLGTFPRLLRFLENESLIHALDVIRTIATKFPQQLLESQQTKAVELDSLISQLWETADAATLRSGFTRVYLGFIQTIFHPVILRNAVENVDLRGTLTIVAADIMRLGHGKRSIRPAIANVIRKAFMHTPESPRIIGQSPWLIDIVIELVNYQQNDCDKDFTVEHPLSILFDDVAPGTDHYTEYYGDREIYSQVYMFDMLSRMDETDRVQVEFVKALREKLFSPWTENFAGMSIWTAWKKHTQLQTLILLERFVEKEDAEEFLDRAINKALCHERHPRYRFLFEWIISLCILRFLEHRNCLWKHLQFPEDQNPKLQVSLLRVALMVARGLPEGMKEEYFTELVHTAIPLTSNTKVVVRHQAIAMTLEFWEDAERFGFTELISNPLFQRVHKAVTNSAYYKEFQNAKDYRTFDGVENLTLAGIFSGSYLKGGDEVEVIPADSFLGLDGEEFKDSSRTRHTPVGVEAQDNTPPPTGGRPQHSGKVKYHPQDSEVLVAASTAPIQTKASDPSSTALTAVGTEDRDLILVASLLDNNFNLGGVSRVSEIMGVHTLTFNSLSSTKTSEFTSVSVHSESWLDLVEVPIPEIAAYLREKRAAGYTAVGVEQTDRSVILGKDECRFPKKTVLLLGTEKFGIPAELLGELDWCVEIPQKGRTRSMNVQTAAAVVLYEACRQEGAEK